jgi:glycine/D-amino acid oxidase-like deaminating enzyme
VTGSLDFGPSSLPATMHELLKQQEIPAELVDPARARTRWPGFAFADADTILYHPDGGVIDAERAMAAMRRLAAANGAEIHYGTRVTEVTPDGTVRTGDQTYQADTVIVAAGAWLAPLVGQHVKLPELTVTQTQAFHFQARKENSGNWPTFIYYGEDAPVYGLPSGRDAPGAVKVGVHGKGTVTSADDRDGVPDSMVRDEVQIFVRRKIPGLQTVPSGELTCLYTSTATEDFIVDRRGALVIVSACSGHGAKFAPLIGEFAADLASGAGGPDTRFALPAPEPAPDPPAE